MAKRILTEEQKARKKEYDRAYRERNREELRERSRKYRVAHPDKVNEAARKWQQAHLGVVRKIQQRWKEAHPDRVREAVRKYRHAHPDKVREAVRVWGRANSENRRIREQKRRAKRQAIGGVVRRDEWERALSWFGGRCAYCGENDEKLTLDHIIPISAVGCPGHIAENIVPACPSCNFSKGSRELGEWLGRKFGEAEVARIVERIAEYQAAVR